MGLQNKVSIIFLVFGLIIVLGCSRSNPDSCTLRYLHAWQEQGWLYTYADVPEHPLTLPEVIRIALRRNLDLLVKEQERVVQEEVVSSARLKILPTLTADGVLSIRSDPPTFTDSAQTSQKLTKTLNLKAAWGLVDFGLTYFRALQERKRACLQEQQFLRVRQNLVLDVLTVYWQTVAAQKAMCEAQEVFTEAMNLRLVLQKHIENRNLPELHVLRIDDKVVETQLVLARITYDYQEAKAKLMSLLGIPPSLCFELEDPDIEDFDLCLDNIESLEEWALIARPELFVKDIEERISADEVRINIIQMFPNAMLFGQYSHDANRFLVNHNWMTVGASATWNLLSIPFLSHGANAAKQQMMVARVSRLAISMAIMAQVRLAYLNFLETQDQYRLAQQFYEVKSKIVSATNKEAFYGALSGIELVIARLEAAEAKYASMQAYAEWQASIEQLNNSLGEPVSKNWTGELVI